MVKARAGWMGMGRGAGSTALGLFQILPVFLCIFPSGKEQPLYFADFFPVFLAALGSPPPFPCPWASFPLPLLAAVCHMFKISKWGSVLVRAPPDPRSPSSRGGCISLTSSSLSPRSSSHKEGDGGNQSGEGSREVFLTAPGYLVLPFPGAVRRRGDTGGVHPHMNTPMPDFCRESSGVLAPNPWGEQSQGAVAEGLGVGRVAAV